MVYNFALGMKKKFNQNIEYKDNKFYNKLARTMISLYAPGNVKKMFLQNAEVMSYVAYQLMLAEEKWDGNGTIEGYRKQKAKWAIGHIVTKHTRKKDTEGQVVSIYTPLDSENQDENNTIARTIPDISNNNPEDEEELSTIIDLINHDNDVCTPQQRQYMSYHFFDNMNYAEIGRKENISRERVRQVIEEAIFKIREKLSV